MFQYIYCKKHEETIDVMFINDHFLHVKDDGCLR